MILLGIVIDISIKNTRNMSVMSNIMPNASQYMDISCVQYMRLRRI
jgi:hypothetical protein